MALVGSPSATEAARGGRPIARDGGHVSAAALVVLAMLGCYVVLKPYYLLPSGLPQIADLMLVVAVPFALLLPQARETEDAARFKLYMMAFCFYAALVNIGWTFALMYPRMALGATFYLYNLGLLIVCLRIGTLHPKATFLTLAYAIALSAVIQAASAALAHDSGRLRQIASFNNPNQLGYWSLLSLCIFWAIAGREKIKWYIQAPTAICLIYTAAASLSKSSMIATALLCLLHIGRTPKRLFVLLLALVPAFLVLENTALFERVSGRLHSIGEQEDDSLQARGFPRLVEYPEYILTGAGEGALFRFDESEDSNQDVQIHEIHSTFLTILFSYGLVGAAAFVAAIWRLYRLSYHGCFLYVLPPFFYGLTHQGLRFSFLWLLLALVAVLGMTAVRSATNPGPSRSGRVGRESLS
jgi:O-Antigen ligase